MLEVTPLPAEVEGISETFLPCKTRPLTIESPHMSPDPEALIEEARRRQHRRIRRRRFVLAGVLATALGTASLGGWLVAPEPAPPNVPGIAAATADSPVPGLLTVANLPLTRPGYGPEGWYGLSAIGRNGRLHPIVRCPGRDAWCGEVISAAWSPDGRLLAISTSAVGRSYDQLGLHVIAVGSGHDRLLRAAHGATGTDFPACGTSDAAGVPGSFGYEGLVWSPDGTRIAYACGGALGVVEADGGRSHLIDFGIGGPTYSPSWSPDGKWLAFVSGRERPGFEPWMDRKRPTSRSIWIAERDGSRRRLVAHDAIGYPAWSPSGARIAYQSRCGTVRLVTPAGAEVTPAARTFTCHGGVRGKPIWSSDGSQLAIGGQHGVFVSEADGSGLLRLSTRPTNNVTGPWDALPSWRPPETTAITTGRTSFPGAFQ